MPPIMRVADGALPLMRFMNDPVNPFLACAMTMRMMVDNMADKQQAGLGSPGVDELRWKKPVYPGDTLRVETKVFEKRRSKSRPEMGIFKSQGKTFNQHGEVVLEMVSNGLIQVREPATD